MIEMSGLNVVSCKEMPNIFSTKISILKSTYKNICLTFFFLVVHELRPADIKVVAALGDSATVSLITQGPVQAAPLSAVQCDDPHFWVFLQI